MTEKYQTAADLAERHKFYCFGGQEEDGRCFHGDVRILCDVAGVSATYSDERYKAFGEYLVYARQFNVAGYPEKELDVERLDALAGAGENMMRKFFGQDIEAAETGPKLDMSLQDSRDEMIERVLQDTSAISGAVAKWLAKNENFRTGHFMSKPELVGNFVNPANAKFFVANFPGGEELHTRINKVLADHGLEPLADLPPQPTHQAGGPHLRLV